MRHKPHERLEAMRKAFDDLSLEIGEIADDLGLELPDMEAMAPPAGVDGILHQLALLEVESSTARLKDILWKIGRDFAEGSISASDFLAVEAQCKRASEALARRAIELGRGQR